MEVQKTKEPTIYRQKANPKTRQTVFKLPDRWGTKRPPEKPVMSSNAVFGNRGLEPVVASSPGRHLQEVA